MKRLFTYIIPIDEGAAPNPFHGLCSLAICKPKIRREARPEDWVIGLGSKNAPSGDLSGCVVYAMRVEEVLTLQEYDRQASARWPHRLPNVRSLFLPDRLGDCIYDFSKGVPVQRLSVHGDGNVATDLSGLNVLISQDFYYFGSRPKKLPDHLLPICPPTQGHRSDANAPYFDQFVSWARSLASAPGQYGWPDCLVDWANTETCGGCVPRKLDGEHDAGC